MMFKIIADNLAKDDTITVAISSENLRILGALLANCAKLIHRNFPTFCTKMENANTFLQMNKTMMLVALQSMQHHIKRVRDKYIGNGTLHSPTPKKIKFTSAQLAAFHLFNFNYANGFDKETNIVFYPLVQFWNDQQPIPIRQVELEHNTETIEI